MHRPTRFFTGKEILSFGFTHIFQVTRRNPNRNEIQPGLKILSACSVSPLNLPGTAGAIAADSGLRLSPHIVLALPEP